MGWSVRVTGLVVLVLVVVISPGSGKDEIEVDCDEAIIKLKPCLGYLKGGAPAVPSEKCCRVARMFEEIAAASQPLKKSMCECLKKVAKDYKISPDRESQLPKLCKLKIGLPINPNVDCNAL